MRDRGLFSRTPRRVATPWDMESCEIQVGCEASTSGYVSKCLLLSKSQSQGLGFRV